MERNNIIVLTKGLQVETWGSITEICDVHKNFSYLTLRTKKFPFTYKGVHFQKVPYRTKQIDTTL